MNQSRGVIIDTSVLISFLRGEKAKEEVVKLLRENRAYITGIIMAELIQGLKNLREEDLIIDLFKGLNILEVTTEIWIKAGKLSLNLRRQGKTIPLTDAAIAILSIEHYLEIYTFDRHFELIDGVKLYKP